MHKHNKNDTQISTTWFRISSHPPTLFVLYCWYAFFWSCVDVAHLSGCLTEPLSIELGHITYEPILNQSIQVNSWTEINTMTVQENCRVGGRVFRKWASAKAVTWLWLEPKWLHAKALDKHFDMSKLFYTSLNPPNHPGDITCVW